MIKKILFGLNMTSYLPLLYNLCLISRMVKIVFGEWGKIKKGLFVMGGIVSVNIIIVGLMILTIRKKINVMGCL